MGKTYSNRSTRNDRKHFGKHVEKDARFHNVECCKEGKRQELGDLLGTNVKFSGEIEFVKSGEPLLLKHVVVNKDVYLDHVWVQIDSKEHKKLKYAIKGSRVYMTGKVVWYPRGVNRCAHGLGEVRLVDE